LPVELIDLGESTEMEKARASLGARRRAGPALSFLICLALVGMMADGARAQTANLYLTYWSDDRGPTEQIGVVDGVATVLYLWIEGGGTPSTSTPCLPAATGDEICAVRVELLLADPSQMDLASFAPENSFDSSASTTFESYLSTTPPIRFSANAVDLGLVTPPASISNRLLGSIEVTYNKTTPGTLVSPGSEESITAGGVVVRSNLELDDIMPDVVVVPEPSFLGCLAIGIGTLGAMLRLRGGRAR
jgi:hypothetical protein